MILKELMRDLNTLVYLDHQCLDYDVVFDHEFADLSDSTISIKGIVEDPSANFPECIVLTPYKGACPKTTFC